MDRAKIDGLERLAIALYFVTSCNAVPELIARVRELDEVKNARVPEE